MRPLTGDKKKSDALRKGSSASRGTNRIPASAQNRKSSAMNPDSHGHAWQKPKNQVESSNSPYKDDSIDGQELGVKDSGFILGGGDRDLS